jgi:dipeptidyl aminopeptidase/acylaminoacyl peptidase
MGETQNYVPKSVHASQRPGYWTPTITSGLVSQLRNVTGAVWSPDGRYLYYAHDFNGRADIMRLDLSDKSITQVTTDFPAAPIMMLGQTTAAFDFSLSPDGSQIVYPSQKDGKAHLISSEGGVAKQLCLGEGAQGNVAFSPDGKQVAFTAIHEETQVIAVAGTGGNQWPRIISDPNYFAFTPRWFKDGKRLVYFEYDSSSMPSWENRLVLADLETGQTKILVDGLGKEAAFTYTAGNYAPSPDGKYLAYVSEESGWGNIYLMDLATGQSSRLVRENAEHHEPVWSPDGTKLAYLKSQSSTMTVQMVTLDGQKQSVDEGQFVCVGLAWSPDGQRLTYAKQNPVTPPNLWMYDLAKNKSSQVTTYKVGGLDEAGLVMTEVVHWKSPDGLEIEGLLTKPANLQKGKHPLLLYIHGGPIMQYNLRFEPSVQYWVNRGWVVLQPNFRGSTGYGRDFRRALLNTWGDQDMLDSIAGVEFLKKEGLIDPSKVVSWGLSGGGYATLRLLTGWPDLFKAGVALEGVSNLVSFPDQVDRFCRFLIQDLLGNRSENLALYEERSPTYMAGQIKAPLMILMGELDLRVPPKQGEEMVEALEKAGKTDYEYHEYPGEAHGWRKTVTIKDYHERMERFLTKWVLER